MRKRRADNENRDVKERLLTENAIIALKTLLGEELQDKNVFVYLSYSSEASTELLIQTLMGLGVRVFCPRVEGAEMFPIAYGEDFCLSKWGIREPIGERFCGEMDAAITPFLAVDTKGNRLGYGGGYYDRYFSANPSVKRIAYGFDFQVVQAVPVENTDKPMHAVVTDKRCVFSKE